MNLHKAVRGRPPVEVAVIRDAALDIRAALDEQEVDELHPAEALVDPMTRLVMELAAVAEEAEPFAATQLRSRLLTYLHAMHDHLIEADADNHRAEGCTYCMLTASGATYLTAEAQVKGEFAKVNSRLGARAVKHGIRVEVLG